MRRLSRDHRRVAYPLLTSIGTFGTGFGALYLLWRSGRWPGTPGLFDYASATWGDGLLLPLSAGALVYAATVLPATDVDRQRFVAAGAAAGALGLATQVVSLVDPQPRTDWTLPGPHRFNAAGWYHAAYLVGTSGLFGGLSAVVLGRLSAARGRSASVGRAVGAAGFALAQCAGFAVLVVRE